MRDIRVNTEKEEKVCKLCEEEGELEHLLG